jgi:hypothetical protein
VVTLPSAAGLSRRGPEGTLAEPLDAVTRDLLVLRTTLARELDTINEYERMMHDAGSPEVRTLLAHLRDEEKEHVAECMQYIRRLDAVQDRLFLEDVDALVAGPNRAGHPPAAPASAPKAVAAQSKPAADAAASFTVGSLKRR